MPDITIRPRRHSMIFFFFLAFTVSWTAWIPGTVAVVRGDGTPSQVATALGSAGPLVAALLCSAAFEGRSGLRDLGRRLVTWRVRLRWYMVALLGPAVVSLASTGIALLLGARAPDFGQPPFLSAYPLPADVVAAMPWLAFLPVVFLQQLVVGSALGEEPGWRGYALPRLQHRLSGLTASLCLGALWGLWHLPLWVRPGQQAGFGIGWELLRILAVTVIFTWLFNHTRGSLLLALLLHASIAVTGLFLSSPHPAVQVALTWLLAAGIVARCGPRRLSRAESSADASSPEPETRESTH